MEIIPLIGKFDETKLGDIPFNIDSLPDGWLRDLECNILYNSDLVADGPIIEIGTWEGRSTCCLDYGKRDNPRYPILDVFDFGDTVLEEFTIRHGSFNPPEGERERLLKVITAHGGVAGCLKQNLADRSLGRHITGFHFCDITHSAISRIYEVMFCDVSHGEDEIHRNVTFLKKMIDNDNYLAIFDDTALADEHELVSSLMNPDKAVCFGIDNGGTWMVSKFSIMAKGKYCDISWML